MTDTIKSAPLDAVQGKVAPLTHAHLARGMSRVARAAATSMAHLAEGMWNPDFCAADASDYALSICEDIRRMVDEIAERARVGKAEPQP